MEKQMIVRIDPALKDRLNRLARAEGKTSSQVVRELISDYIKERDIGVYIDGLWDRIGAKLAARGTRRSYIDNAIAATRQKRG